MIVVLFYIVVFIKLIMVDIMVEADIIIMEDITEKEDMDIMVEVGTIIVHIIPDTIAKMNQIRRNGGSFGDKNVYLF